MIVGGHGGNIRAASELYGFKPEEFIDFSANINPNGFPDEIKNIIIDSIDGLINYPDIEYKNLLEAFSEYYDLPVQNIAAGNGSAELIDLFIRTSKIKNALIVEPNFYEYERSLKNNGIIPRYICGEKEDGFKPDVNKIISELQDDSFLFLSSPNNPVGYIYKEEEIKLLIEKCKNKNSVLFVDEAFIDFIPNGNSISSVKFLDNNDNLVVLKSLTKILAIPGLRLGMILGPVEIVTQMKLLQIPWSINHFALQVGEKIYDFDSFIERSVELIQQEKERFAEKLNEIKSIEIINGKVNYILCKLNSAYDFVKFEMFLGENKILIRSCSNYPGLSEQYFRIAVKNKKENDYLISKVKEYFDKL